MLFSRRCNKKLKWHHWKYLSVRIFISTAQWSSHFFKLTNRHVLILEVTGCIQVDSELLVELFYKTCSVPLPQWFHQGQDCCLLRKSIFWETSLYTWNRILKTVLLYLTNYRNIRSQRNLFTKPTSEDMHCYCDTQPFSHIECY